MARQFIIAADIYEPKLFAHATKVDDVVYTSGIVARDADGRSVGKGNLIAQTERVYENLGVILRAAGADWADVVKVNSFIAPSVKSGGELEKMRQIQDRYLPPFRQAGVEIFVNLLDPDLLLEVEVIAHIGATRQCFTGISSVYSAPHRADAVKVRDMLYVGGQQAVGQEVQASGTDVDSNPLEVKGTLFDQARFVYRNHDTILKAAGATRDQLVKIREYISRSDALLDQVRNARTPYVPVGRFVSTSVVAESVDPTTLVQVELDASFTPKQLVRGSGVCEELGGPHAIRTGNTIRVQGQDARDRISGETTVANDTIDQADYVYRNLDDILRAADADWNDVVHVRTYCRRREDVTAVRQVRGRWLRDWRYASTMVLTEFIDPDIALAIEVIAAVG